jgi:hypothetical protein
MLADESSSSVHSESALFVPARFVWTLPIYNHKTGKSIYIRQCIYKNLYRSYMHCISYTDQENS